MTPPPSLPPLTRIDGEIVRGRGLIDGEAGARDSGVRQVCFSFAPTAHPALDPRNLEGLSPSAREKRRTEYGLSRACARESLAMHEPRLHDFIVRNGPDRAPTWPAGYVGSITHTAGYVAVATARRSQVLSLGIDAEIAFDAQTIGDLAETIALSTERSRGAGDRGGYYAALFSIKESLYKALNPLTRQPYDFRDFEVVALDFETRVFQAVVIRTGLLLSGFVRRSDRLVETGVVVPLHLSPYLQPAGPRSDLRP